MTKRPPGKRRDNVLVFERKKKTPASEAAPLANFSDVFAPLLEQRTKQIEQQLARRIKDYAEQELGPAVEKVADHVRQLHNENEQLRYRLAQVFETVREAIQHEHDIARAEIEEDGKGAESALAEAEKHILREVEMMLGHEAEAAEGAA